MPFNEKFLPGPGAGFTFFQKEPLAAGGNVIISHWLNKQENYVDKIVVSF
jgi:hypothetical protein